MPEDHAAGSMSASGEFLLTTTLEPADATGILVPAVRFFARCISHSLACVATVRVVLQGVCVDAAASGRGRGGRPGLGEQSGEPARILQAILCSTA